jgi:hypothetical protein
MALPTSCPPHLASGVGLERVENYFRIAVCSHYRVSRGLSGFRKSTIAIVEFCILPGWLLSPPLGEVGSG